MIVFVLELEYFKNCFIYIYIYFGQDKWDKITEIFLTVIFYSDEHINENRKNLFEYWNVLVSVLSKYLGTLLKIM